MTPAMPLATDDLTELADLAQRAAMAAGAFIVRSRPTRVVHKDGQASLASQVVTEIDRQAETIILDVLAPSFDRFDLALLTEEREDDGGRQHKHAFWCIDPLDGTLPFVEGHPGYAVSIALVAHDGTPLVGVVFLPTEDALYRAVRGQGATRNGSPYTTAVPWVTTTLSSYVDRSFPSHPMHDALKDGVEGMAAMLGLDDAAFLAGAGGVVNACRVLEDTPACYFKLPRADQGGGSIWDFAATACLTTEAGGVVADAFGHPLDLNRPGSTFMNHRGVLFASDRRLADLILARCAGWIATAGGPFD
jgi:3'-phosphoadenosine 5'-phosphosulfate (PAPS) 3'-phosphatase